MYVGPVHSHSHSNTTSTATTTATSTKGKVYVGVVWDDTTRGKHNGTILDPHTNQWVSYFTIPPSYYYHDGGMDDGDNHDPRTNTTTTATCASFVPIHKVHRGVALTKDLILSKYVPLDSTECLAPDTVFPDCTVQCAPSRRRSTNTTTTTRYKPIQFIGEYQIRRHQQLELHHPSPTSTTAATTTTSTTNTGTCTSNTVPRQLHSISLRSHQLSSINVHDLLQWTTTTTTAIHASDDDDSNNDTTTECRPVTHSITELDVAGNLLGGDHHWSSFHDIMTIFPNLQKFSIASNCLYDTITPAIVTTTTTTYPHQSLQHLNLQGTRLSHIATILEMGRSFPNLKELIVANNHHYHCDHSYSWNQNNNNNDDIDDAASAGGLDRVLDLATELATIFPHLTLLDCSNCCLNYWSSTSSFVPPGERTTSSSSHHRGIHFDHDPKQSDDEWKSRDNRYNLFWVVWSKLPKLQNLLWNDNRRFTKFIDPYRSHEISTGTTVTEPLHQIAREERIYFPALEQLHCVHTGLSDWTDLVLVWDESIPTLRQVRLQHCPLVHGRSVSNMRHQLIGDCPQLTMINATAVTEPERREVAKQVIGMYHLHNPTSQSRSDGDDGTPSTMGRHRNYDYWRSQYPDIASSSLEQFNRDGSPTSTTTAPHLPYYTTNFAIVNVTFRSMASSSCTKEPFTRRLPTQMTVRKVKALCARQFDTEVDDQILCFRQSNDDNSLPQIMDCNDHTLHYYGVPDGAEILMHEGNETNAQSCGTANDDHPERQRRELEERVDRLEKEMNDFKLRQTQIAKK